MRRSSWSTAVYLLLVFVSGTIVGGLGYRLYVVNTVVKAVVRPKSSEEVRAKYIKEMQSRLKLNEQQGARLNVILDETRKNFSVLHQDFDAHKKSIEEEHAGKVRAMLDPQQIAEYEKMRQERALRREQQRKKPQRW